MQIQNIPVGQLKPDPNQPRSKLDQRKAEEMAATMKNKNIGVINAIEVDSDNIIVTGHTRWAAAKIAGLETVPCKIINPKDRFLRQVIENIHQGTMTDWDTAKALRKLLEDLMRTGYAPHPNDEGKRELARRLGKSEGFIRQKLELLSEPEKFQRAAKEGKLTARVVTEAKRAPEEYRDRIKEKFIKNELPTRDSVIEVTQALNRTPEKAEELLSKDYSEMTTPEIISDVRKISPSEAEKNQKALKEHFGSGREIIELAGKLETAMENHPIMETSEANQVMLVASLLSLANNIKNYLSRKKELVE